MNEVLDVNVEALDGNAINEAENVKLTVIGARNAVMLFAEGGALAIGGQIVSAVNPDTGEDLMPMLGGDDAEAL